MFLLLKVGPFRTATTAPNLGLMKKTGRKLFYMLPPGLRFSARRLFYLPYDTLELLSGKRDPMTPPKGMIYTGGGDFKKVGKIQVAYLKEFCGLHQDSAVLDIGSGIGRTAIPLAKYLSGQGRYDGFDVVKRGVDWCNKHIASKHENFQFKYIPLNNDLYRKSGTEPERFKFPYPDGTFDLAVVNSVFTHMVAAEVENYFVEMARVLRPGGVVYATFFLYDDRGTGFPLGFDFPFDYGHYRLMDDEVKSANVAFSREYLQKELVGKNGFQTKHLFLGSWRGLPKKECKEFQDIAVLEKISK